MTPNRRLSPEQSKLFTRFRMTSVLSSWRVGENQKKSLEIIYRGMRQPWSHWIGLPLYIPNIPIVTKIAMTFVWESNEFYSLNSTQSDPWTPPCLPPLPRDTWPRHDSVCSVKASNFRPHGHFGPFFCKFLVSLDESCTKNEQNRICGSKVFLRLLIFSFFCRTRFDYSNPFWKSVQSFHEVHS
jgi:hypothetical protein